MAHDKTVIEQGIVILFLVNKSLSAEVEVFNQYVLSSSKNLGKPTYAEL